MHRIAIVINNLWEGNDLPDILTKNEKKILVPKDSRDSLIVSPQKLIIPASGKKNIRFIALNKKNKSDRVYRVNVAPIVGEGEAKNDGQHIKILIAYDVLTFIRPLKEEVEFSVKRDGKKITFKNTGNTNILLRKAKQCSRKNSLKCYNIVGKRLYAGLEFTQELSYDNEVEYTYSVGDKIHTKIYD
jgi:P pilus assembly chaperone PapD